MHAGRKHAGVPALISTLPKGGAFGWF